MKVLTKQEAEARMNSRFQEFLWRLHRETICRFFHRKHLLPIPEIMKRAYPQAWYCDKCNGIAFVLTSQPQQTDSLFKLLEDEP